MALVFGLAMTGCIEMSASTEELVKRLEMLARLHAVMLDRLREREAGIIAMKELEPQRLLTSDLIRDNVTGVMLETDWRHKKTGNVYQVIGGCRIEATNKLGILYAREGVVWCRPSEEFLDG